MRTTFNEECVIEHLEHLDRRLQAGLRQSFPFTVMTALGVREAEKLRDIPQ
jgi:hypothetical protein